MRKRRIEDPHAEREAERYEKPIPSRELILQYLGDCSGPRTHKRIARDLEVVTPEGLQALTRRLKAMEREGQVILNRREAYGPVTKMDLLPGRVTAHPDGYGFLVRDDGGEDVFLSGRQMRSLLHGDRAVVRVVAKDRRGRTEGALVEVLERANKRLVGRFFNEGGVAFVAPDNKRFHQDILIPGDAAAGAQHGQIVMVDIVRQPDWRRQPIGRVSEILGNHMAPGMEIDIAIRAYDLPHTWPETVLAETAGLGETVRARDRAGRVDLRSLPLVTIDGEDARDFDDAVYCERTARGWRLLVAIADVAHYVAPGSALDIEAHLRGTSVYFPDRAIPMLPEALSNGLCSLNPELDRLCLVCEIDVEPRGSVRSYRFRKALMRSAARFTYREVNTIAVERQRALRNRYRALTPHLDELYALYRQLRHRRDARGAIDFESTETKIVFDAARKIERIVPTVRTDAHRLIEECMIAANVAAAEFLEERGLPCLYRIHEPPAREKLDDVRTFLGELGLSLGGGAQPEPRDYAALLAETAGRPDAHLIQTLMLRSLRLAVYNPVNAGHFGLAHGAYTHFTSPIRRYPDLLVHRAIHHLLAKKPASEFRYGAEQLGSLGDHCSLTERRADEATRDAVAWLKCEFMQDKIGEVYSGIITAVTGFGFFVELKDIYVEGLVHVTSLKNDYYHHDPLRHELRGEHGKRSYRIATEVSVRVVRVDLDGRRIDFDLVP